MNKVDLKSFDLTNKTKEKSDQKELSVVDTSKFLMPSTQCEEKLVISEGLFTQKYLCQELENARRNSNNIISATEYPSDILTLEELTKSICETVEHFTNLDVNRNASKESQEKQARSIVHQKRRALAELFKTLSTIGLSYRAGFINTCFGVLEICDSPPMNFNNNYRSYGVS